MNGQRGMHQKGASVHAGFLREPVDRFQLALPRSDIKAHGAPACPV